MLPSKDEAIARQEIENGACPNRYDVGEEIIQVQVRDEDPHQQEVAGNGNEAIRQMESNEPADETLSVRSRCFQPGPPLMPNEIVYNCNLDGDRGCKQVIQA